MTAASTFARKKITKSLPEKNFIIHEYYTGKCIIYIFKEEKCNEHT